jgi:hypothetical protein
VEEEGNVCSGMRIRLEDKGKSNCNMPTMGERHANIDYGHDIPIKIHSG